MAKELLCAKCGHQGNPKVVTKGSIFIEIMLWLFFIVPGIIYSIWRLSNRYRACPKCKEPNMIPLDSPVAKKMLPVDEPPQEKPAPKQGDEDFELKLKDATGRYIIPE